MYRINEIFYSLQGEGLHAGCPSVFVRFSGCNLKCIQETAGFQCDTPHDAKHRLLSAEAICSLIISFGTCKRVVFTGGEPLLQLNNVLVSRLKAAGFYLAIETNGTVPAYNFILEQLDWVTVSPKQGTEVVLESADEVKVVLGYEQLLIEPNIKARYYFISPAFDGPALDKKTLDYCIKICKATPKWRLSVQRHKLWDIR